MKNYEVSEISKMIVSLMFTSIAPLMFWCAGFDFERGPELAVAFGITIVWFMFCVTEVNKVARKMEEERRSNKF